MWTYRVIKIDHDDTSEENGKYTEYGIHEVYDESIRGGGNGYTERPQAPVSATFEGLIEVMSMMLKALSLPVLTLDENENIKEKL